MKKLISLLIVTVMVFATFSVAIPISAATYSGTCGDNLTWELDTESGLLAEGDCYDLPDLELLLRLISQKAI